MSDERPALPVLDGTCGVREHAREGTYQMQAACVNCGSQAVITLTKTHKHPGTWDGGPACPICGVNDWTGWKLA